MKTMTAQTLQHPMRIRKPFKPHAIALMLLTMGSMLLPRLVWAIHFPDTAQLVKDYHLTARKAGKPVDFSKNVSGDSVSVHLEWKKQEIVSVRFEQSREFAPDSFTAMVSEFGGGGVWHELPFGKADSALGKTFPGLEQQWLLKGYGGEKGWVGSGLQRGRFFLTFQETAPMARAQQPMGPLHLGPNFFTHLDTSSEWLRVPCQDSSPGTRPICFIPGEERPNRIRVRIQRRSPLLLDIRWEEAESSSLQAIKNAMLSIPEGSQAEYAQDLSNMLLVEAQLFLVKVSQRLPDLFTWPSWQWQDCKSGRISPQTLLSLVRRPETLSESLPAFRQKDQGGIRLDVDLFFNGAFRLEAEELQ